MNGGLNVTAAVAQMKWTVRAPQRRDESQFFLYADFFTTSSSKSESSLVFSTYSSASIKDTRS